MSTHNPTATVISTQQEVQSETRNCQSFRSYPSPTAQFEDVVQSSDLFWEKLKSFHKSFGTKFMVPTVGGKALDLHHLFVEVTSRGGLEKVVRDRKWKEVIAAFNFPSTITSASFVLRKYYLSLLYHFEQVYQFHKQVPSVSVSGQYFWFFSSFYMHIYVKILFALFFPDDVNGNLVNGSATVEGVTVNQFPGSSQLQLGSSVNGTIDGKFDNGYLITVTLGSEQLKGVLYHIPNEFYMSQSSHNSDLPPRRHRKRSRLLLRDPSRPKSHRSGYNFFFAEHYAQLKPLHYGQEKVISKKIGLLWNNLTEAEKEIYQEKGLKDKERYKNEMLEYRSSYAQ
ncbi:high mobility group B protein 10 isoform X2 [Ricinus communis]|uniref:high mobility group B protein 10 isoform X2 n=1 Tax=Ricinus communis TaxID=3988 RepID=UPI00201A6021|nr:high mobility group B protein 10 isoform X2 [Ricinus communis]